MTLNDKDKKTLAGYDFRLTIQNKVYKNLGTEIEMNGKDNLPNVFLEECLHEMAGDLRYHEKQFEQYKKEGLIVKDKDGEWNLADKHAQKMAGKGVVVDNNED